MQCRNLPLSQKWCFKNNIDLIHNTFIRLGISAIPVLLKASTISGPPSSWSTKINIYSERTCRKKKKVLYLCSKTYSTITKIIFQDKTSISTFSKAIDIILALKQIENYPHKNYNIFVDSLSFIKSIQNKFQTNDIAKYMGPSQPTNTQKIQQHPKPPNKNIIQY